MEARVALLVGWLAACGNGEAAPVDSAPEGDAAVATAATHAAPAFDFRTPFAVPPPRPSGLNKNECPLRPAVDRLLFGVGKVIDCGDLPKYAPDSLRRAAQRCILDAWSAGRAFRFVYESYSYDTLESAGVAARDGNSVTFIHRSSTPQAPWIMRARLGFWTYNILRARDGCTFENGDLCLDADGGRSVYESCEKLETF